jgi:hypothetical protein
MSSCQLHTNRPHRSTIVGLALAISVVAGFATGVPAQAQPGRHYRQHKYMLDPYSYKRLQRAQKLMSRKQYVQARRILQSLLSYDRYDRYPRALCLQLLANSYIYQNNYRASLPYLKKAIKTNGLPSNQERNLLYNAAIAYSNVHQPLKAITYLQDYLARRGAKPPPSSQIIFLAQTYYEAKQPQEARRYARKVINQQRRKGLKPPEVAYEIILNTYVKQKNFSASAKTIQAMLRYWPRQSNFWSALANTQLEMHQNVQALHTLQKAYALGLLTSKNDVENLIKLNVFYGNATEAATMLQQMLDSHRLPKTATNLQLLVNAWSRAHNQVKMEQAITEAAPSAPNGSLYLYEADLCYRQANWNCVAHATRAAIRKGGLTQIGQTYLLEATALIKLKKYIQAEPLFKKALQYPDSAKQAKQWIKYIHYKASIEAARYGKKHPSASPSTKQQSNKTHA